jgi:Putative beta-barrel porin-2, OmpL-like. bbp2
VQSAGNFFYSHAHSYQFAGPFTHWGALASQKLGTNWQLQGGIINGWNNLDSTVNHAAFIGGLKYTSDAGDWWSSFAVVTGDEQNNPANLPTVVNGYANRTRYSWIISKQIGCCVEYVFHQWAGVQQTGEPGGGAAKWYGIDQYLYYRLNERWRLGTRVEWFRDEDGTRVGLTESNNPNKAPLSGSYGSWTIGANWAPGTNLVVRPELRWDSYAGTAKPYDDGRKTSQLLLGFDAIVQF